MDSVAVTRDGTGPEVVLVHGGASPATTWAPLACLRGRWTLVVVHRRGYPPSPAPDAGQDFEVDADDITAVLRKSAHIVAHSYGGLGALIAATRKPTLVRSLTLIEPALYLVPDDPQVAHLKRLGDAVLTEGLDTDPAMLREFLQLAGVTVGEGPLPPEVARGVRRAQGSRLPGEARPALDIVRDAGIPSLVVSGGHFAGIERTCDALTTCLRAQRLLMSGAGHFVASAPGFADALEQFLRAADDQPRTPPANGSCR
jgi:pimeloyl-ACP methyl ester carboxylesterase